MIWFELSSSGLWGFPLQLQGWELLDYQGQVALPQFSTLPTSFLHNSLHNWPDFLLAKAPLTQAAPTVLQPANPLITIAQGLILGLVQGITEFLPISSTAHLLIFSDIFGWKAHWTKEATDAIQFGSVIAVMLYFWQDIRQILSGALRAVQEQTWQREEWKIFLGIIAGTVPALLAGFVIKKVLNISLDSPLLIAVMAIVMSLLLALAERVGSRKRQFDSLEITDGFLVGLGQMVALLPGASRSGSTLTAGLLLGLERSTAARFSFLLGIPALTIATLIQGKDALAQPDMLLPLLFGTLSAFGFSYLSIAWLLKFLQRQSTWVFVWYRLGLGAALLVTIAAGILK